MNTFEASGSKPEGSNNRQELMTELLTLRAEATRLANSIKESGENAGPEVELGGPDHVDFGYTEALDTVNERIKQIEEIMNDQDDVADQQRNLGI